MSHSNHPTTLPLISTRTESQHSYNSFHDSNDCDELSDNNWNSWHSTAQQYKRAMAQQHTKSMIPDTEKLIDINDTTNTTNITKLNVQSTNTFELLPAGSIRASVFNLSSATLGAGALALPYALQQAGLVVGIILLCCAYILSCYSIELLIQASIHTKRYSYETITCKLFTTRYISILVDVNILLFCFGTCVAYLIGVVDIIQPVMLNVFEFSADSILGNRSSILILFTICIMLPLSCCQHINQLRFTSFIGVCTLLFLVLCVVIRTIQYLIINGIQYSTLKLVDHSTSFSGTIISLSIMMYAFTSQPNIFQIYNELLDSSQRTMSKVVSRSFLLSSSVYISIGVAGVLHYQNTVQSDILRNIDIKHDYLMAIAQLGLAISLTLAYPLNVFPSRNAITHMLWPNTSNKHTLINDSTDSVDTNDDTHLNPVLFYSMTIAIVGSSLLIALFTTNLGSVFSIIGSTTSAVVCFVLPPIFYLCSTTESLNSWKSIQAWCLLVTGILLGIVATATTVIQIIA